MRQGLWAREGISSDGNSFHEGPKVEKRQCPGKKLAHQARLLSSQSRWSLQRAQGGQGSNDWN